MKYTDSISFKYNIDSNGNPISINIVGEKQQVSPINNIIQLVQIPDEFHRLVVKDEENNIFHEVFDIELITNKSYRVDYSHGLVYFHESHGGKTFSFTYYGRGVELIHASRVTVDDNPFGNKNMQDLADMSHTMIGIVTQGEKDVAKMKTDFDTSQASRTNTFNSSQTQRSQDFTNAQNTRTQQFNTTQQQRDSEFKTWKDTVTEENATVNLQNQINNIKSTMVTYRVVE